MKLYEGFDENKEYGVYIVLQCDTGEAEAVLRRNMKLTIPKEFRKFVICPTLTYMKDTTIRVGGDNYKQLGATKEQIGWLVNIPGHTLIGWIYRRTG